MNLPATPNSVPAFYVARLQADQGLAGFSFRKMPLRPVIFEIDPSPEWVDRFHSYVDSSGGADNCWPWLKFKSVRGYGFVMSPHPHKGAVMAHRIAYILNGGTFEGENIYVLHSCHNRACCNPDHLRAGTHSDNMKDMYGAGRGNRPVGDDHWSRTRPHLLARGEKSGSRKYPENYPSGDAHWTRVNPENVPRGEALESAKLTEGQVREIRRLFAAGGVTKEALGRMFSINGSTIGHIVKRETWKHIT